MDESRRDRKKRLTRQQIVAAAIALFEEQGYEQTTVAQIAAAADVDPKTFFNYFGTKDEVLFTDLDPNFEVLLAAIAARSDGESPGAVLRRALQEYATHRRELVPAREPEELSAALRLAMTTPVLRARGVQLLLELQQRIADELVKAFPDDLDPIAAAAMTGAVLGAIQQACLTSVQLGRSQQELWAAAERALDIASRGLGSLNH